MFVKGDLCRLLSRRRRDHLTLVITMTIEEDLLREALRPRRRCRLEHMNRGELLLQILVLMTCDLLTKQGLHQCTVDLSMIEPRRQCLVVAIIPLLRRLPTLLVAMIDRQDPTVQVLLTATDGLELLQLLSMLDETTVLPLLLMILTVVEVPRLLLDLQLDAMMPTADVDLCLPLLELQVGTMKADLHLPDLLLGMEAMGVDLTEDLKRIIHLLGITMRLRLEVGRCIGADLL